MGIPSSIQVGPFRYRIESDPDEFQKRQRKVGGADATGFCCNDESLIYIDTEDVSEQAQRDIVLHEMLHACLYVSGLHGEGRKLDQEEFISRSASILLDALRRNPELVAYLTEDDEEYDEDTDCP